MKKHKTEQRVQRKKETEKNNKTNKNQQRTNYKGEN